MIYVCVCVKSTKKKKKTCVSHSSLRRCRRTDDDTMGKHNVRARVPVAYPRRPTVFISLIDDDDYYYYYYDD